jgi:hypothetical protein
MSSLSEAQLMEAKNESKVSLCAAWLSSPQPNCSAVMVLFQPRKSNCHDFNLMFTSSCEKLDLCVHDAWLNW